MANRWLILPVVERLGGRMPKYLDMNEIDGFSGEISTNPPGTITGPVYAARLYGTEAALDTVEAQDDVPGGRAECVTAYRDLYDRELTPADLNDMKSIRP